MALLPTFSQSLSISFPSILLRGLTVNSLLGALPTRLLRFLPVRFLHQQKIKTSGSIDFDAKNMRAAKLDNERGKEDMMVER